MKICLRSWLRPMIFVGVGFGMSFAPFGAAATETDNPVTFEYLQFGGTDNSSGATINTGYRPNCSTTRVEFKFRMTDATTQSSGFFTAGPVSAAAEGVTIPAGEPTDLVFGVSHFYNKNNTRTPWLGVYCGRADVAAYDGFEDTASDHVISFRGNEFTLDGATTTLAYTPTNAWASGPLVIGAASFAGYNNFVKMRLMYFRIYEYDMYEGELLQHEYVAATNSSGVATLFDTVAKTFLPAPVRTSKGTVAVGGAASGSAPAEPPASEPTFSRYDAAHTIIFYGESIIYGENAGCDPNVGPTVSSDIELTAAELTRSNFHGGAFTAAYPNKLKRSIPFYMSGMTPNYNCINQGRSGMCTDFILGVYGAMPSFSAYAVTLAPTAGSYVSFPNGLVYNDSGYDYSPDGFKRWDYEHRKSPKPQSEWDNWRGQGTPCYPLWEEPHEAGSMCGTLGGVRVRIDAGYNTSMRITRLTAANAATTIPAGSRFVPDHQIFFTNAIHVLEFGGNDGWPHRSDTYLYLAQKVQQLQGQRYIFTVPSYSEEGRDFGQTAYTAGEIEFLERFGSERSLCLRHEMANRGVAIAHALGYSSVTTFNATGATGLMADSVHFNYMGNHVAAYLYKEKLEQLGWLESAVPPSEPTASVEIVTAPWQQNVYTNRFTILCETAAAAPGLELQYGSGYAESVAMTSVDSNGGTKIYKGRVVLDGHVGETVPYRLAVSGTPLSAANVSGEVKLWPDDASDFSVAVWGDNQGGTKTGHWDQDKLISVQRAFEHMMTRDFDFGISSGDNSENGAYRNLKGVLSERMNGIFGRYKPYYFAWGNHDELYPQDAPGEVKKYIETGSIDDPYYQSNERGAYYLYRGNVLFVFVHWKDYAHSTGYYSEESSRFAPLKTWLAQVLATDRARNAKFRVLVQHGPFWLETWGGNEEHQTLLATAKAGGIDLVLSGHMHGYERIEKEGIVQLTNGGLGHLDVNESVENNYGSATKLGGHIAVPYLWACQSSEGVLGPMQPANKGCIIGYGELTLRDNVLGYRAHGFNADGSYIGVFDDFAITSKTVAASAPAPAPETSACANPVAFADCATAPVTNARWAQYQTAIGGSFTYAGAATDPVTGISKKEINRFIGWLNRGGGHYRLPTVAELKTLRGTLAGTVTEWTSDYAADTGWCRILGGNAKAASGLWCNANDEPAIQSDGCSASYLGFRLVAETPSTSPAVTVTIKDWTGKLVKTVSGRASNGTYTLDVSKHFNATIDCITAFDGGTVSAAPSTDVVTGSTVTWSGLQYDLATEIFVQPRVPYNNFSMFKAGDPWAVKDPDSDTWYFTWTSNNGLVIRKTTVFPTNQFAYARTGYSFAAHPADVGDYKYYIWAPELHCIGGKWYAYLSASNNSGSSTGERSFVLWLDGDDPYSETNWKFGSRLVTPGGDRWAIDGTILDDTAASGKLYYIWSGWPGTSDGTQNLYLAEMSSPTNFAANASRILISTPTESWERLSSPKVNEGPVVLRHGNAVHIVYSCNGCWTDDYSLSLLTCTDGNFTNQSSWVKSSQRLFVSRPGAYGPGHCSFTKDAAGRDFIIYHAKNVSGHSSEYQDYRDLRMQPIAWHGDYPVFGAPRPYDSTLTKEQLDLDADYCKESEEEDPVVPVVDPQPVPISPNFDAAHTIVCYGDSLTEGYGAQYAVHASLPNYFDGRLDGVRIEEGYPYWLSTLVSNDINVVAQALAGVPTDTILAWQGASVLKTSLPLTLPAAANEYVPLSTNLLFNGNYSGCMVELYPEKPWYAGCLAPLYPLIGAIPHDGETFVGASEGAMSGWLNGVHVRIKGRYPAYGGEPYQTICRTEAASAPTAIPVGTRFIADAPITYADAIQVICAGANDGAARMTSSVFPQLEAAVANVSRYLVVSPIVGVTQGSEKRNQASDTAVEQGFASRFGNHFLNSRQQLRTRGLTLAVKLGMMSAAAAAATTWDAADGSGLIYTDNSHLNTAGYAVKAYLIYEKLVQLGYVQGELLPSGPTDYGADDTKAATYTWKGGNAPWEYTTSWTADSNATCGIPSSYRYATANFPATVAAATTCTLTSNRSVKNALFNSPNLTFVISNATLSVYDTLGDSTWGAYNFGNTASGSPKIVFKGANPGIYEATEDVRSNFGCIAGGASGYCTIRYEVPAANWSQAPIRTFSTESKVCFWENVRFEIDATALGVPTTGTTVTVPLAWGADGVYFMADNFAAVVARSEIACANGATGELVRDGSYLKLLVTATDTPEPPVVDTYDITLESLLAEMTDAETSTRLAEHPWTGRLWSSYDRRSTTPDNPATWTANDDWSEFVATNTVGGRTEYVMVDAKGAGALTRLWTANGYDTVYRFYIDGATEPVISGVGTNLIGGHVLCPAPLADEVSLLQPQKQRAQDLYLPIPFSRSLVVTAELQGIPPKTTVSKPIRFWYNAEVRTYADGTTVEPFSAAVLTRAAGAIAAANAVLAAAPAVATGESQSLDGTLAAGATKSVSFTGAKAIRSLAMKLAGSDEPLRTVRVKIAFDGETTVDVAAGQLFGAGFAATPYSTVAGGVAADGTMSCRQVMPFGTSCTVTLENTGSAACTVSGSSVIASAYDWDAAKSLHFGAFGFEQRNLSTRRGSAGYFEIPWVTLAGQGYLVGNTLALDNSGSDQWWGEGDEKIWVDGESFPSYFGTGTEDFFGYAWGHGEPFTSHPFLSVPISGAGLTGGRRLVTAVRNRRLDTVPFTTSLKLNVEIWHWESCLLDYAPATFWYARPGVTVTPGGLEPDPQGEQPEYDPATDTVTFKANTLYTFTEYNRCNPAKAIFEENASILVKNCATVEVNKAYLGASGNTFTAQGEDSVLRLSPFAESQSGDKTWTFNADGGQLYLVDSWTFQASDTLNCTVRNGGYLQGTGITPEKGVYHFDITDSTIKFDAYNFKTAGTSLRLDNATVKSNYSFEMGASGAETLELVGAEPLVRSSNGQLTIGANTTVKLRPELGWSSLTGRLHSNASTTATAAKITLASGVKFDIDVSAFEGLTMDFTFCLLSAPSTPATRTINLPSAANVTVSGSCKDDSTVEFTKSSDNRYVYVTVHAVAPAPQVDENSWTVLPSLSTNIFMAGAAVTVSAGTAEHGTAQANYTSAQLAQLAPGCYTFRSAVAATEDYAGLVKEIDFVVLKPDFDLAHTIVCYGDSLTAGYEATPVTVDGRGNYFDGRLAGVRLGTDTLEGGLDYTYYLSGMVPAEYNVISQARGAQWTDTILGWQGGLEVVSRQAVTLPAGGVGVWCPTNLCFTSANPYGIDGGLQAERDKYYKSVQTNYFAGLTMCDLPCLENFPTPSGRWGTMSGWFGDTHVRVYGTEHGHPWITSKQEGTYGPDQMWARIGDGAAVEIPAGTTFVPDAAKLYGDAITVIFAGTNDGKDNYTTFIPMISAAVARIPSGRYVVVSGFAPKARTTQVEAAFQSAFGEHYLNMHDALETRGLAKAVELGVMTAAEATAAGTWECPAGLVIDPLNPTNPDYHPNSKGYAVIAAFVKEKLVALGYVPGSVEPEPPEEVPEPEYDSTTDTLTFKANTLYPFAADRSFNPTKAIFEENASLIVTNGATVAVNKAYLGASGNTFTVKERAELTLTPFAAAQVAGKTWNFDLDNADIYLADSWTYKSTDVINATLVNGGYLAGSSINLSTGVFHFDLTDSTVKFNTLEFTTAGTSVKLDNSTVKSNWGFSLGTSGAETLELAGAEPFARSSGGPLAVGAKATVKLCPELGWSSLTGRLHSAASATANSATITLASGAKFEIDVSAFAGLTTNFTFCLLSAPLTPATKTINLPGAANVTVSGSCKDDCTVEFTKSSDDRYVYVTIHATGAMPEPVIGGEGGPTLVFADGALQVRVSNLVPGRTYGCKYSDSLLAPESEWQIHWFDPSEYEIGPDGESILPFPAGTAPARFYRLISE